MTISMGAKREPRYVLQDINGDTDVNYDYLIDSWEQTHNKTGKSPKDMTVILNYFDANGITWRKMPLGFGDIFLNRGYGELLERKRVADLIASFTEKPESNGKVRMLNELEKMCNPAGLSLSVRRRLIVNDGLQMALQEIQDVGTDGEVKTTRVLYNASAPSTHISGEKTKRGAWAWEALRIHPNSWIGMLVAIQNYMPVVLLGGMQHTCDYLAMELRKAKADERYIDDNIPRYSMRSISRDAEIWRHQQMLLQQIPGMGAVNTHEMLMKYETPRRFFAEVHSDQDFDVCSSCKDPGVIDKKTQEMAAYFNVLMDTKYVPPPPKTPRAKPVIVEHPSDTTDDFQATPTIAPNDPSLSPRPSKKSTLAEFMRTSIPPSKPKE